jgi:hypothetical protein
MTLVRLNIVFASIYGNEEKTVDVVYNDPTALDVWAILCRELDSDQTFGVAYIKKFWKVKRIEKISMCYGCNAEILNQLGHMDRNGCLSDDHDDPVSVDRMNLELMEKYCF